jgi:predicted DNA-binding transcriptional regulator AlpA
LTMPIHFNRTKSSPINRYPKGLFSCCNSTTTHKGTSTMLQDSQNKELSAVSSVILLDTREAAAYLGYKPRMLEARRIRGGGPPFVRISSRGVRYRMEDLQTWIQSRIKLSTSTQ